MSALFPRWTNTALGLSLAVLVGAPLTGLVGLMIYVRTPWNTGQFDAVDQPVQFDHRHHVIDDGIDCLYCHQGAETSDYAGVPETEVCMGCHAQIWNESPLLEPVRRSYFSGRAIPWNRVHDLPDFVYFSHAVHVQRGIGCAACHGRVDLMARVFENEALTMGFCVDCHSRASELPERPLIAGGSHVTSVGGVTPAGIGSATITSATITPVTIGTNSSGTNSAGTNSSGANSAGANSIALASQRGVPPVNVASGADELRIAAAPGENEPPAPAVLFGTIPANVEAHLSLGPRRHDALTTCTACHR